ncbi:MAG: alpha/beta hydrolase [Candidatus Eutrophobiaceae bacterium]
MRKALFNVFMLCFVLGVTATLFLQSEVFNPRPDLKRLFEQSQSITDQPPVIFIHGVMGSKLYDPATDEEAWFKSAAHLFLHDYEEAGLEFDPETLEVLPNRFNASELAGDIIGYDFYGNIIRTIDEYGGYQFTEAGQPVNPMSKHYYVFVYDWRQDNVQTVRKLANLVEQIRKDYEDPTLKVDLVAHSMGGLIARYFIRYGKEDVLETNEFPVNLYGGERVRRVVLLGTPNLGSTQSLNVFINGIWRIHSETLITMPSLYQLLPHPINNWLVTLEGKPLQRDLFDIDTWRRFQWAIFDPEVRMRLKTRLNALGQGEEYLADLERFFGKYLERARRFVWSLTVSLPEDHPTLIVFGGDCHLTPARILIEEIDGKSMVRTHPDEIENPLPGYDYEKIMLEPGDGEVTKASLLGRNVLDPSVPRHQYSYFPLDHAVVLCERHSSLTGNVSFQDNLLNALLVRD